ncbi:hypothetical protein DQ04_06331030 [Trypanosoma grayi]|uniref:hypothetical protein n=1 Tax=Trypanosoma grayi TaxID=71804 RepID=UPI0004F45F15|nr:hypothetical protein DQ04_06331030 [Trypanosoma grayi]KEG08844.1 hypothetical protein DQ04_06331030 [Trypanosoma grayi]
MGKNGGSSSKPASASETQFWNCLKKGDVEGLEGILLRRVEDTDTGAVTFVINREASRPLVNTPNVKKMLPLSYAVSQGMEEQGLQLLLRAGAIADATDGTAERATALHTACWGEDDIAVALLLRCGASPIVEDAEGRTPLHVLASLNAAALFSYILETVTTPQTEKQEGLLYLEGRPPVVVSPFELLSKKDLSGFTVLHTAVSDVSSGSDRVLTELLDYLEATASRDAVVVRKLVNATTESGSHALHLLLSLPNCNEGVIMRTVTRLLQLGASPAAPDNWGQTPLTVAVMSQSGGVAANVVRTLLQAVEGEEGDGALLERVFLQRDTEKGYALIHHAVATRNVSAVKVMVAFLKSIDEVKASQRIRQWIGEPLTEGDVSVAKMAADRACEEIAQVLLSVNAIDEDLYKRCKELVKREEEEERQRRVEDEKEGANISGSDDGADGNTHGTGRKGGDFSGFGSTVAAGSRVQQARKAKAQAAAQRRKQVQHRHGGEGGGNALRNAGAAPLWLKLAVALLIFLMVLRGVHLLRDGLKTQ